MQLYKSALAALAIGSLAVSGCSGTESVDQGKPSSQSSIGELGMSLLLPDDSQIANVNYNITGPGGFTRSGVVPVANSSKLTFRVGSLPIQNGYTISLGATTGFGEPCSGSVMFNVLDNQTTTVTVALQCQATDDEADLIVNGTFASCPLVTSLQAIPAEVYTGGTMAFAALISHGTSAVTWSSTAGSFAPATSPTSPYSTVYTCPATAGVYTITATVSGAGAACNDKLTMTVECSQNPGCGNGTVDSGEECDDGNSVDTDACRNSCETSKCGDGVVKTTAPAEQCDAVGLPTATCTATCTTIVCGDGKTEGAEACDDGNTVNNDGCANNCVLPGCGDGIIQAARNEQCDDSNTVDTDACTGLGTTPACQTARCGDGIVRAGTEACDDGNTVNDDLCSNTCTVNTPVLEDLANKKAGCKACRAANCRDFDGFDAVGNCFEKTDTVAVQQCIDLRDCMFGQNSGYDATLGPIQSFCGTADVGTTCGEAGATEPKANGPCRVQWALATSVCTSAATCTLASINNTSSLGLILNRASNPNRPSGAATSLTLCDTLNCSPSCTP